MSGGGGGYQSTTSQQNLDPAVQAQLNLLTQVGSQTSSLPYQTYNAPRIAGFTDDQNAGFNAVRANAGTGQSQYDTASGIATAAGTYRPMNVGSTPVTTGQWNSGAASAYMSPYISNVVDTTNSELQRNNAITNNMVASQAGGEGAFGGSREALIEAENNRNLQTTMGNTDAQIYNTGYTNAQQAFQADQARALQAQEANQQSGLAAAEANQQAGLTANSQGIASAQTLGQLGTGQYDLSMNGANALLGIGGQQQQMNQNNLNLAYSDFQNQTGYPSSQVNKLANWFGTYAGLGQGSSSTTSNSGPSAFGQIAGLGAAGVGALGASGAFGSNGWLSSARGGVIPYTPRHSSNGYPIGGTVRSSPSYTSTINSTPSAGVAGIAQNATQMAALGRGLYKVGSGIYNAFQPVGGLTPLTADQLPGATGIPGADSLTVPEFEVSAPISAPVEAGVPAAGTEGLAAGTAADGVAADAAAASAASDMGIAGGLDLGLTGGLADGIGAGIGAGALDGAALWAGSDAAAAGVGLGAADAAAAAGAGDALIDVAPLVLLAARGGIIEGYDDGGDAYGAAAPAATVLTDDQWNAMTPAQQQAFIDQQQSALTSGDQPMAASAQPADGIAAAVPVAPAAPPGVAVPVQTGIAAAVPAKGSGKDNDLWSALMLSGFGTLASTSRNPLQALGQGAEQGLKFYAQQKDQQADRDIRQQQMQQQQDYQNRSLNIQQQNADQTGSYYKSLATKPQTSDYQRKYDNWLAAHPGDTAGALTYANGDDPNDTSSGTSSVFQQKVSAWLDAHPGDKQGALDFASGHKQMGEADIQRIALQAAQRDAANMVGLPPEKQFAFIMNRSTEYASRLRGAGAGGQPGQAQGAPGGGLPPAAGPLGGAPAAPAAGATATQIPVGRTPDGRTVYQDQNGQRYTLQ